MCGLCLPTLARACPPTLPVSTPTSILTFHREITVFFASVPDGRGSFLTVKKTVALVAVVIISLSPWPSHVKLVPNLLGRFKNLVPAQMTQTPYLFGGHRPTTHKGNAHRKHQRQQEARSHRNIATNQRDVSNTRHIKRRSKISNQGKESSLRNKRQAGLLYPPSSGLHRPRHYPHPSKRNGQTIKTSVIPVPSVPH